ncbi:50S ribosomal protein L6 [Thiococcus pfennigii]|jgi:large subunit ribosomal protein L6|uniref:50S ribosomal protein L6 n=1 Tax=Thiococcus pfennigii TaxID=1057 RepID=UPI001904243F|nr:50S ribosomal protein L6 [Thiococcus pfennigii]MBK1731035.1 50S ribosomal protein L6 [Thiococcus pfennigii]
MSRVAKAPITVPKGVAVEIAGQSVQVKGPKGTMNWIVHPKVAVTQAEGELRVAPAREGDQTSWAQAGTTRALLNNMVVGCGSGFVRKLNLVGVGYRAQAQGRVLNLALGFSHPINFAVPEGIEIATPSPTEIQVSGADKQQVGQVAAEIRRLRPPEPYKGKGVRYADEEVVRKEAKKK